MIPETELRNPISPDTRDCPDNRDNYRIQPVFLRSLNAAIYYEGLHRAYGTTSCDGSRIMEV
jgi:hypothetical protein